MNNQVSVVRVEMTGVVRSVTEIEIGRMIDVQYFISDGLGNRYQIEQSFNVFVPDEPYLADARININDKLHIVAYTSKGLGLMAYHIRLSDCELPPHVIITT